MSKLKEYVTQLSIDCIAITNHNLFDLDQFNEIKSELDISVFPGIEIDLEKGHLLLISSGDSLEEFADKCAQVKALNTETTSYITTRQLKEIYGELNRYLLIPHYDKRPVITKEVINELSDFISAGEVTSAKKFKFCVNDKSSLVPVLFSDLRFKEELEQFSPRQTFVDTDDTSFRAIKLSLLDKSKVSLSDDAGHSFFQIFENGQKLSTGLNIILGERSSGKSYTLNKIHSSNSNIKYIRQFELLEKDEELDKRQFDRRLSNKQSNVSEQFLKEFKAVIDDILNIDRFQNERDVSNYLDSLLKVADEEERKDVFSNCVLFNENNFNTSEHGTLRNLISSTETLIDNTEYRDIINKHVAKKSLMELVLELIEKYNETQEQNLKKMWINSVITNIKNELQSNTSSAHIKEVDFYNIELNKQRLAKFEELSSLVRQEIVIEENEVRRFKVVASTRKFTGALELKNKSGIMTAFSDAFSMYDRPIEYLDQLKLLERIPTTDYYKYFVEIQYRILNEHGTEVSGGERSEFNLLEKIQDAHHHDLLLIDEPESSFDNLFLKNEVNEQIKQIAKTVPVIIVTHNNTVGASIKPDYVLYTKRVIEDKKAKFRIYSGNPSDTKLTTTTGEEISNYDIMLNCLEAGDNAYQERGKSYETLKN